MDILLNEVEARIIGCLIEKEATTPEYYPLTLNALINACNQKSNRFPVVEYDEKTVNDALEDLRDKNIVYVFTAAIAVCRNINIFCRSCSNRSP